MVEVYNLIGQTVFQQEISEEMSISTSNWPAGRYFVRVNELHTSVVIP